MKVSVKESVCEKHGVKCLETTTTLPSGLFGGIKIKTNNCPECKSENKKNEARQRQVSRALVKRDKHRAYRRLVPPRYKGAKLTDFPSQPRVAIEKWVKCKTDSFFTVTGICGCGKTHYAYAVYRYLAFMSKECEFINGPKYISSIYQSMRSPDFYVDDSRYQNVEFLIIDDIGADRSTEFVMMKWYDLINTRYENNRKTFIVSNMTAEQFAKKYGDRIASRVFSGTVKIMGGTDMRVSR